MAEEYPDIPVEHLLGLGSAPGPRSVDRDLDYYLDYYLGPTGIPDRLRSANELANPIAALGDLGAQSEAAANPDLSPEERRRAALTAALGTGLLAIPAGRALAKLLPAFRSVDDDAARAVVETLTGASPDLADPARRQLLPGERLIDEAPPPPRGDPADIDYDPPYGAADTDFGPADADTLDPPDVPEALIGAEGAPALGGAPGTASRKPLIADEGPFFSTVLRAVDALPQERYGDTGDLLASLERSGARPDEIRALGLDELAFEGPITRSELRDRVSERLGAGLGDVRVSEVSPIYRSYFPAGLGANNELGYNERVISLPRNAVPGAESYASPHWESEYGLTDQFPIMHYRTGTFLGPNDERYFHLGEIQSDYVQAARKRNALLDDINGPLGEIARDLDPFELDELAAIYDEPYDVNVYRLRQAGLITDDTSLEEVDSLVRRLAEIDRLVYELPMPPLPVAGTTDKFTQLGLRSALADAVASEADYFTIASGDAVHSATYGDLAGQQRYYDEIVPRNMVKVLKDLNRRSDVSIPIQLERVPAPPSVYAAEDGTVLGLRLTPEIRDAIRAAGMPVYRDGGLVDGPR